MRAHVVVSGNLSLDDTITPAGSFPAAPGGDALYAALAVSAWGIVAQLVTLVGEDYPQASLDRIAAAGVDVSTVRGVDGPTVHYRVTYAPDGSRTFEWVGPEERLLETSPTLTDYGALDDADWLHLAAMPIEAHELGVTAGRLAGVPISLDPHEEYVTGFEDRLRPLVEGVAFLPSELEARLLLPDLRMPDLIEFGLAAAERLDAWEPALVAIKLGALGSVVRLDGVSHHVPAEAVRVVDPTGAGDAYAGAFVVGWLVTGDPVVAAACGTVAASETIAMFGAFRDTPEPPGTERLARVRAVVAATGSGTSGPTRSDALDALEALERHLLGPSGEPPP